MFSNVDISKEVVSGALTIEPFNHYQLQPASYDVRLSRWIRPLESLDGEIIDPFEDNIEMFPLAEIGVEGYLLEPGAFVLGQTYEVIGCLATIACDIAGKSSIGRLGPLVHHTAGFIDPGFKGHITLEISNPTNVPIRLYRLMRIAQVRFWYLDSPTDMPYGSSKAGSKYQGQNGPTVSRYFKNIHPRDDMPSEYYSYEETSQLDD